MRPMKKPQVAGFHGEAEEAAELGCSLPTLRRWRARGIGPEFFPQGRRILYKDGGAARWLEKQAITPEALRQQPVRRGARGRVGGSRIGTTPCRVPPDLRG
jgi:hypothetical protein